MFLLSSLTGLFQTAEGCYLPIGDQPCLVIFSKGKCRLRQGVLDGTKTDPLHVKQGIAADVLHATTSMTQVKHDHASAQRQAWSAHLTNRPSSHDQGQATASQHGILKANPDPVSYHHTKRRPSSTTQACPPILTCSCSARTSTSTRPGLWEH